MRLTIKDRVTRIRSRIEETALHCGRHPGDIRLVAVGKTHPVDTIQAAISAGVTIVGENYVQEARTKFDALAQQPVHWHFIGHLQTNKAKYAVRMFDLIHTVDSLKLALEIDRQAKKSGKVQDVLIQVNLPGEATKSGVASQETPTLARQLSPVENIKVRGLMTIPPFFDDPDRARPYFAALRDLRDHLRALAIPDIEMDELSMGMTGDFETAIEEGATIVRIGTAIFGERA